MSEKFNKNISNYHEWPEYNIRLGFTHEKNLLKPQIRQIVHNSFTKKKKKRSVQTKIFH